MAESKSFADAVLALSVDEQRVVEIPRRVNHRSIFFKSHRSCSCVSYSKRWPSTVSRRNIGRVLALLDSTIIGVFWGSAVARVFWRFRGSQKWFRVDGKI